MHTFWIVMLLMLATVYVVGVIYMLAKSRSIKLALIWPLWFVIVEPLIQKWRNK